MQRHAAQQRPENDILQLSGCNMLIFHPLGYGWIIVGLILKVLSIVNPEPGAVAIHALTLGVIEALPLGMTITSG
jgi:uncharacterized protein involved in response to NO